MRKIEKPTIKHTTIVSKKGVTIKADSPYGVLAEVFPECKGKLAYAWEHEVEDEDNFRPITGFFINDAMGGHLYFRTNSRAKAQELCDLCFGKNKYTVKIVVKAAVR